MTQTAQTAQTPAQTVTIIEPQSPALIFLEAVLLKDVKTLRGYGRTDAEVAAIDIETQIAVAAKLLSATNTAQRAQSKRVIAASVLGTAKPAAAAQTPATATPTGGGTFYQSGKSAISALRGVA